MRSMVAPGAGFSIVVAVDRTAASDDALALACEMAREGTPGTDVHVVRALLGASNCLDIVSERELLGHLCATYAARFGVGVTPHLSLESPEVAIIEIARCAGATLIVVGDRRRRWFERLVVEPLADRVMRHAPCPIVVTRSRAEPGAASSELRLSLSP
jgi:nucleotide-binding universal stress UspA family protein